MSAFHCEQTGGASPELQKRVVGLRRGVLFDRMGHEHDLAAVLVTFLVAMARNAVVGSNDRTATGLAHKEEAALLIAEMDRRGVDFDPRFKMKYLSHRCAERDCARVALYMVAGYGWCNVHRDKAVRLRAVGQAKLEAAHIASTENWRYRTEGRRSSEKHHAACGRRSRRKK